VTIINIVFYAVAFMVLIQLVVFIRILRRLKCILRVSMLAASRQGVPAEDLMDWR
jgi:hypothetical protein